MLIDVVVASVLGLVMFSGLVELTIETVQLNRLAADKAVAATVLIDLEGQIRLNDPAGGQSLVPITNLCASPKDWLLKWCADVPGRFERGLGSEGVELSGIGTGGGGLEGAGLAGGELASAVLNSAELFPIAITARGGLIEAALRLSSDASAEALPAAFSGLGSEPVIVKRAWMP